MEGHKKNTKVDPNYPLEVRLINYTFGKMCDRSNKKVDLIHELLNHIDSFLSYKAPKNLNERVLNIVRLNMTSHFLLEYFKRLDENF